MEEKRLVADDKEMNDYKNLTIPFGKKSQVKESLSCPERLQVDTATGGRRGGKGGGGGGQEVGHDEEEDVLNPGLPQKWKRPTSTLAVPMET